MQKLIQMDFELKCETQLSKRGERAPTFTYASDARNYVIKLTLSSIATVRTKVRPELHDNRPARYLMIGRTPPSATQ